MTPCIPYPRLQLTALKPSCCKPCQNSSTIPGNKMTAKVWSLHWVSAKELNLNLQFKLVKSVSLTRDTCLRLLDLSPGWGRGGGKCPGSRASPDHSTCCRGRQLDGALPGSEASLAVLGIIFETSAQDRAPEKKFLRTSPGRVSGNVGNWERNARCWLLRRLWGRTRETPKEKLEAGRLSDRLSFCHFLNSEKWRQ